MSEVTSLCLVISQNIPCARRCHAVKDSMSPFLLRSLNLITPANVEFDTALFDAILHEKAQHFGK
jgi:hypothetical protein